MTSGASDPNPKYSNPVVVSFNATDNQIVQLGKRSRSCTSIVIIGGFQAFDASSGRLLWTQALTSTRKSSPVIARINRTEVIVSGSKASIVLAIDALSGKILWESVVDGGTVSTPAIHRHKNEDTSVVFVGKFPNTHW